MDTLIARRVDIVVHSNSFIEGPFDGTSPTARAVDRAAAAGILWFNSAGNYAQLSWGGEWGDADADGDLDWPNGDSWTFPRAAGLPITFALSWTSPPGGPATDIDLVLERQDPSAGAGSPSMGSNDRQSAGAPPSERITGYSPPADGTFRLRAVLTVGPAAGGAPHPVLSRDRAGRHRRHRREQPAHAGRRRRRDRRSGRSTGAGTASRRTRPRAPPTTGA